MVELEILLIDFYMLRAIPFYYGMIEKYFFFVKKSLIFFNSRLQARRFFNEII